jgi:hypothetical protein
LTRKGENFLLDKSGHFAVGKYEAKYAVAYLSFGSEAAASSEKKRDGKSREFTETG